MNRILSLAASLLTFLASLSANAQDAQQQGDRSLIWRISGKGLAKPSYLFGTIHMICREDFFWTDPMKQSLANSDKICFEMNLADTALMTEAAQTMILRMTGKLLSNMTPERMKMLEKFASDTTRKTAGKSKSKSKGGSSSPFDFQSIMGAAGWDCPHPISYEDSIMKMVEPAGKPIMGLEQPMEQIEVLESLPIDTLIMMVLDGSFTEKMKPGENNSNEILVAYKNQDLPALYNLINNAKGMKIDMDAFINNRNKKWISRMEDKMNGTSVFFAVGAGHLWGPGGVITLLRNTGYTVEPVR